MESTKSVDSVESEESVDRSVSQGNEGNKGNEKLSPALSEQEHPHLGTLWVMETSPKLSP